MELQDNLVMLENHDSWALGYKLRSFSLEHASFMYTVAVGQLVLCEALCSFADSEDGQNSIDQAEHVKLLLRNEALRQLVEELGKLSVR